jgi:hypothetical protein
MEDRGWTYISGCDGYYEESMMYMRFGNVWSFYNAFVGVRLDIAGGSI